MDAMIAVVNAAFSIETFLEGTRTDAERMSEMMEDGEFLLAEEAGSVIAIVYTRTKADRGYFGMLAVDPSRQGEGLGRRMVEAAENHCRARGWQHMDIDVLSLRTELPAFYRKLGYAQAGIEEFHPSRPLKPGVVCYCIVMSKAL
jgi:ribosomal protein S18 acetylase RimI-like enzyme